MPNTENTMTLQEVSSRVANLDSSIRAIAEAQRAAIEKKDDATLDVEKLLAGFTDALSNFTDKQVAAQRQLRAGTDVAGEIIGPEGAKSFSLGKIDIPCPWVGVDVSRFGLAYRFLSRVSQMQHGAVSYRRKDELDRVYDHYYGEKGVARAYSAGSAGAGLELLDEAAASRLWEDFYLRSRVFDSLPSFFQPADPFPWPLLGDFTWRKGTENTAPTEESAATSQKIFTTTEQVCNVNWSYTLDEDSVIVAMEEFENELARSGAEYMDSFVMNADATAGATGNINLDDATPASDSYYLADGEDGLRHLFLVDNTSQEVNAAGSLTDTHLLTAMANLDKYGTDPMNCLCFPGVKAYLLGMVGLTQLRTVDQVGFDRATIRTGQVGVYNGAAVIPTPVVPLTEDDGKVSTTAANNVKGQVVFANRVGWRSGIRRRLLIEVDRDIIKRQWILVGSFRQSVTARGTRSSAVHTSGVRNITV